MIQDINTIIMTPLTIVVLLCITTALLFVCIYLCVTIKDLKELIRDKMSEVLECSSKVLKNSQEVNKLSASINQDCRNLIKTMQEYLHLRE